MSHDEIKYWAFGNSPEMADSILACVLEGKKTATSSLFSLYNEENDPIPKVGEVHGILDSAARPRAIIEIVSVEVKKFKDVDADFARQEGEGDLSLNYWQKVHQSFFSTYNPKFCEEDLVVCEKFIVKKIIEI
jgi:uncharacterized protein YhfF